MFESKYLLLCLCYFTIDSNASPVPFIDKCVWNDKPCLISSSQKALPHFGAGLPQYGVPPLDPIKVDKVTLDEGGLKLVFNDMTVTGPSKCKIINVEREQGPTGHLIVEAECPIDINGNYVASGKLISVPVEGHSTFQVKTNNVRISAKIDLTTVDGKDGEKHWKAGKTEHTFDVLEKATIKFNDLFNGDEEKAGPINKFIDENWKLITQTVGKVLVSELVDVVVSDINAFVLAVPANDLEI